MWLKANDAEANERVWGKVALQFQINVPELPRKVETRLITQKRDLCIRPCQLATFRADQRHKYTGMPKSRCVRVHKCRTLDKDRSRSVISDPSSNRIPTPGRH